MISTESPSHGYREPVATGHGGRATDHTRALGKPRPAFGCSRIGRNGRDWLLLGVGYGAAPALRAITYSAQGTRRSHQVIACPRQVSTTSSRPRTSLCCS
jgi:hypothetical protein